MKRKIQYPVVFSKKQKKDKKEKRREDCYMVQVILTNHAIP